MTARLALPEGESRIPWRAVLAALAATLVGIGLARFAYTPLIPVLIEAEWFSAPDALYLGAANLAGYLAGALAAGPITRRMPVAGVLRAMMALATASFFASAAPLSFTWFFLWRFASGLAGGALMALAATAVLPLVPSRRHGLAGGVIFTGVGLGIAASGTLVPALLRLGLAETWLGLGLAALLLTLCTWRAWPEGEATTRPDASPRRTSRAGTPALRALYLEYALNAAGLVPHMVFLVDYIARGLDRGLAAGAGYWVLFGLGAMAGPMLAGRLADRVGFAPALRLAFLVQAVSVGCLALADTAIALALSSLVVGAFVPGIVPIVLGRTQELAGGEPGRRRTAWALATAAFALGQAAGAYGLTFLFAAHNDYGLLFQIGAGALALALAVDLAVARLTPLAGWRSTPCR